MTARGLLTQLNAGRVAIGAALVARPELVTGQWLGKDGRRPAVRVLARGFGARDAALGAGTLDAIRNGRSLKPWVVAGLACDAADLLGTHFGRHDLPGAAAPLMYAIAGGALLVGVANLADSPAAQA